MVQRFLPLPAENSSESFQIGPVTPDSANETMAMIDSRIEPAGGQPVRVRWRESETDGPLKLPDNEAEAVCLATAQRPDNDTVMTDTRGPTTTRTTPR